MPLRYLEYGRGATPVILLHGLFGSPGNWTRIMEDLADDYYFFAVQFPIDHCESRCHHKFRGVDELTDYVEELIDQLQLDKVILCGNSLGGQVAVDYSLRHPDKVDRLIITGSAGLFERSLNEGKRPQIDRDTIRQRASEIFYDERHCTEEIVEDVYRMLHDRRFARFLIRVAKATRDRNMKDDLSRLHMPTLIIWVETTSSRPPSLPRSSTRGFPTHDWPILRNAATPPPSSSPTSSPA